MLFKPHRRISPGRAALLLGDLFIVIGSLVLSAIIRLSPELGWNYVIHHIPSLGGTALVFLVVFYAGGMYERYHLQRKAGSLILSLITTVIALAIVIVLFYARIQLHIGRGVLLLSGMFICLGTWALRQGYRTAVGLGFLARHTLIVGEGKDAVEALQVMRRDPGAGFRIYGFVSCNKARTSGFIEGVPILGHISRIREFVDVYGIDTIVVATSLAREHTLLRTLRPLRYSGVEMLDFVALMEEVEQQIPLDHIDEEWLMNAAMNSSVIHIRKIKRVMDLMVATAGLIVLSPIALLAAVIIRLDSPGPVLYRQRRCGVEGHPYTLLKLRTMRVDAEADGGAVWADRFDQRITRVGRFLRKWRIDEIPQLINVLKGEMSLVGPRPERPEFVQTLSHLIPFYQERLLVPPGITGWAQVKFPYAASIEAQRRKLQYDLYYIKHMSFFFDVLILLKTFRTIIVGLRHSEDLDEEVEGAKTTVLPFVAAGPQRTSKTAG